MLVGFDKNHSEKTVIGAYVGGSRGQLKARAATNGVGNNVNQVINANGAVIGGYSSTKLAYNAFIDVNLPIGYMQNKSKRTVYNNLAVGGVEEVEGIVGLYVTSEKYTAVGFTWLIVGPVADIIPLLVITLLL